MYQFGAMCSTGKASSNQYLQALFRGGQETVVRSLFVILIWYSNAYLIREVYAMPEDT
jgi:hypothetical protein